MENTKQYETVEALSLPIIHAYHKDLLVVDRDLINENDRVAFLHCTGKTGTKMYFRNWDKTNFESFPCVKGWRDSLILFYDGDETVAEKTYDEAAVIINAWSI
jgi:hypothetical protein